MNTRKFLASLTRSHKVGLLLVVILLISIPLVVLFSQQQQHRQQQAATTGTVYYVSKNGNNADGKSWATAWNELNQINWPVIQPGNTILLDGGSSQMVYTTTLTIDKSGVRGTPITIERATDSGHNGKVVIFGGRVTPLPYCGQPNYTFQTADVTAHGIVVGSSSWIVIDGMNWGGIAIYGHNSHGIDATGNPSNDTFRNMEIYDNGYARTSGNNWQLSTNGHGVYLNGNNLTFEQMNIHDNADDEFDTGVGSMNNLTINRSWLHVEREDPTAPGLPFNECIHQDGYQIYSGGTQGGIRIENSVLGPGLKEGTILGQTPSSSGPGATVNNVTIENTLFLNKDINIMGYPQVKESGWIIDHDTIVAPVNNQNSSKSSSLFLEGTNNTVTNTIFYGGNVYVPDGLTGVSGNCSWMTTGNSALGGQTVDPRFVTDISSYNYNTSLMALQNTDYSLKPSSPCLGKGSAITSLKQLLSAVRRRTIGLPGLLGSTACSAAGHEPDHDLPWSPELSHPV